MMKRATRTQQAERNGASSRRRCEALAPPPRIFVELATPQGKVFSGKVSAAEFSPANGVIQFEPDNATYFGLVNSADLALRIRNKFHFFTLLHASASIRVRRVSIIAEVIRPTTASLRNCGNPLCACNGETERTAAR
jgi:hypothetical protein